MVDEGEWKGWSHRDPPSTAPGVFTAGAGAGGLQRHWEPGLRAGAAPDRGPTEHRKVRSNRTSIPEEGFELPL